MDTAVTSRMTLTLPSDREIMITREFDAPNRLVFAAWTEPEQLMQWYGCEHSTLVSCDIELRVGGSYRYVLRSPDGERHIMRGSYREVVRPERLVYTERYVGPQFESKESVVTVTFVERHGRTTLTSTSLYHSKDDRDRHLSMGVETGAAETLDRLATHLRTVA